MHDLTLYNLQRPEVIASPWSYYSRLLAEGTAFDPYLRCWLLARHADVTAVLADTRFSVAMRHEERLGRLVPGEDSVHRALRYLDRHVSFVDSPDHGRLRTALSVPFRPGHVRLLETYVTEVVSTALDGVSDVVRDLASPVPLRITQRMLGLSVDVATLRRWSTAWGDVVSAPGHLPTGDRDRLMSTVDELVAGLEALVAEHRRTGRRDTVTGLLIQAVAGGRLDEDELIANLMMLVTAGNETTTNLISNAVLALLRDPELWSVLARDRALLPAAIEELARLYPPTQYTARTALVDVSIGGVDVAKGQSVVLLLAAANRDPAAFPDPDRLRLDRPAARHLSFGHGTHFCFGAALARLEARVVLDGLLDRGRPRPTGEPSWRLNGNLRGMDSLPVRLPRQRRQRVAGGVST